MKSRNNIEPNSAEEYKLLTPEQRNLLCEWIGAEYVPAKRKWSRTSYGEKHEFEKSEHGFYVTNGQFKGAMLEMGYKPIEPLDMNWEFRIKPRFKRDYSVDYRKWPPKPNSINSERSS